MQNQFVDFVKIYFTSGSGGNGVISWRKEKFYPKGGPDGGDGGQGGSIILRGDPQLWTLLDLKYRKFIKAEHGQNGAGQRCSGKSGKDEILHVPLGTIAKNAETGEILGEVIEKDQDLVLLKGGHGGKGNYHYKSPTNQAPEYSTDGGPAQELTVILELKVLADVGLVGFPNAGKSTLLSVLSEAKPKIGAYPFTTLVPNLGIVRYRSDRSFVMADIPGIIEGAHAGKGLGAHFLRHIERNSLLLFMVPVDEENLRKAYEILQQELILYNPELAHIPQFLALTKSDMIDEELEKEMSELFSDVPHLFISSVAQKGLLELKDQLWKFLQD